MIKRRQPFHVHTENSTTTFNVDEPNLWKSLYPQLPVISNVLPYQAVVSINAAKHILSAQKSVIVMSEDTNTGEGSDDISLSTFVELTKFQRDILIVLTGDAEMKGLSVKEELEKYYEDTIHHGRLYPNLDTLVDKGLVDKFEIDNRSNGYRLTQTAEQLLKNRFAWERARSPTDEDVTIDDAQIVTGADSDASSSPSEQTAESDEGTSSAPHEEPTLGEAPSDDSILENMRGDFEDEAS